jgi:3'-phosphoadenosine 5'-phosphosulfate sulfotransferase (PAPS reductase)/FAD synthetase
MAESHYMLPEGNVQIAFSGGRTSAYMLHQILQANGDLPPRVKVTFQNTGREHPATLDFVAEVASRWSVRVVWLEYRPDKPLFEVVSHNNASRNGEPFEALIRKKGGYLPNQQQRYCTETLKVLTSKRYLRSLGWDRWTNAKGIRADEANRLNKPDTDRWVSWTPLADAGVSRRDVVGFWRGQPFDLRLPVVNGKTVGGNCVDCFLKSEAEIAAWMRDNPQDDWSERMEALGTKLTGSSSVAFFNKRYSRASLRDFINRQGDWLFSIEGALCQADGGECMQ